MSKKQTIMLSVAVAAVLVAVIVFLGFRMHKQNEKNKQMLELADLDKKEMQNEYEQFAMQYNEMKMKINNDSLVAQLDQEQQRTEELLEELRRVKSSNAAEIMRLKKELATLRKVLRSYVLQIDSLNRMNQELTQENTSLKDKNQQAQQHISNLSSQNESLSEKVEIASQLDATGIRIEARNRKGREARKVKDVKKFAFGFTIVKNVTAANGERIIYARILKPDNTVMGAKGTFQYENTSLEYTEKKYIEYTGEEVKVVMYSDVTEFLEAGTYKLFVFCDKQMIGQTSFSLK